MKDPVVRAVKPRARKNMSSTPVASGAPSAHPHLDRAEDPDLVLSGGLKRGHRVPLRTVHTSPSQTTCSACTEELGAPGLDYRIVLRCTSVWKV